MGGRGSRLVTLISLAMNKKRRIQQEDGHQNAMPPSDPSAGTLSASSLHINWLAKETVHDSLFIHSRTPSRTTQDQTLSSAVVDFSM